MLVCQYPLSRFSTFVTDALFVHFHLPPHLMSLENKSHDMTSLRHGISRGVGYTVYSGNSCNKALLPLRLLRSNRNLLATIMCYMGLACEVVINGMSIG